MPPSSRRMVEMDRRTGLGMLALLGAALVALKVVAGRKDRAAKAVVPMVRRRAGLDTGQEVLMRVAADQDVVPARIDPVDGAESSSGSIRLTASWTKSSVRLNPSSASAAKEPAVFPDALGGPALGLLVAAGLGWECLECLGCLEWAECPVWAELEWADAEWECPVWVDLEDATAMALIAIRTEDLKVAPKAVLNVVRGMAITAVPKVARATAATVDRTADRIVDLLRGTAIAMMTGTTIGVGMIAASGTMTMTT